MKHTTKQQKGVIKLWINNFNNTNLSINNSVDYIEKISNYKDVGVGILLDTSEAENIDWNIFNFNDPPGIISGKFNKENIKSAISKKYFIDISKGLENEMNELSIEKIKSLFEFIRSDEMESARFSRFMYKMSIDEAKRVWKNIYKNK